MSPNVAVSYVERPPGPALTGLVSSTWVQRVGSGGSPYLHRNIPNGGVELVCRLGAVPRLVGPLTGVRSESLAPGSTVVGLRFRPGAAAALLPLPSSELTDRVIDADAVWGPAAATVGARMAEAESPERAGVLLERFVTGLLADAARPDPVVAEAVRRLPGEALGSLRSSLVVSERSFRRQCLAAIGVGPGALRRMLRFQRVLARVQYAVSQGRQPEDLALLAVEAGYADQAHLTRECVRFTGVTPRVFLRDTARACGCGHDHQASYAPMLSLAVSFKNGAAVSA